MRTTQPRVAQEPATPIERVGSISRWADQKGRHENEKQENRTDTPVDARTSIPPSARVLS
jgi:hypothetical protein